MIDHTLIIPNILLEHFLRLHEYLLPALLPHRRVQKRGTIKSHLRDVSVHHQVLERLNLIRKLVNLVLAHLRLRSDWLLANNLLLNQLRTHVFPLLFKLFDDFKGLLHFGKKLVVRELVLKTLAFQLLEGLKLLTKFRPIILQAHINYYIFFL